MAIEIHVRMEIHEPRNEPASRQVKDGGTGVPVLPHRADSQDSPTRDDDHTVGTRWTPRAIDDGRVLQRHEASAWYQLRTALACCHRDELGHQDQAHGLHWVQKFDRLVFGLTTCVSAAGDSFVATAMNLFLDHPARQLQTPG